MSTKNIRSRILEFFPKECLEDIYRISMSKKIPDNNSKVEAVIACLNKYKIDFIELGPGTNRFAILIDGYVFKIALDRWGIQDNINELTVSEELQPYVSKTYECNDLILVAEYVTVISREEFVKKRHEIEKILAIISEGYLLGDVGIVPKNFCNWGYRDTGELVILDYAYIYRIIGDEMMCSVIINQDTGERCGAMLVYDNNFHDLYCPRCRAKHTFVDVRRRITPEHEKQENEMAKKLAYAVTKPLTVIHAKEEDNPSLNIDNAEEETSMSRKNLLDVYDYDFEDYEVDEKSDEDYLLDALALMSGESDKAEEDKLVGEIIKEIVDEQAVINATKLVEEAIEFDAYTNEIDNIREIRETTVTVQNEEGMHHTQTTEIETDEDSFTITLDMTASNEEDETEVVEIVETVTVEPKQSVEVKAQEEVLEQPQQLALEIPSEDAVVVDTEVVEEVTEEEPIDMTSFLIASAKTDDNEGISTSMADAFRDLGVEIPEDSTIEKVTITETTTTSVDVEFAQEIDLESLDGGSEEVSDEDDFNYGEYDGLSIMERIQKMRSNNNER